MKILTVPRVRECFLKNSQIIFFRSYLLISVYLFDKQSIKNRGWSRINHTLSKLLER